MNPAKQESGLRVAIVGATSLKGKEVKQVLEERLFPLRNWRCSMTRKRWAS